jgi:hypothetical protein
MKLIPTTSTSVEKLKASARKRQKTEQTSYMEALDAAAREAGYECWNHVRWCATQGTGIGAEVAEPLRNDLTSAFDTSVRGGYQSRLDALDKRRSELAGKYMATLAERAQGALVERFPPKGRVFHSVEIEGHCFIAYAHTQGVFVGRRSRRVRGHVTGSVSLGVAEIHRARTPRYRPECGESWHICKYSESEPLVPINDLSSSARNALAYEFGILIVDYSLEWFEERETYQARPGWLFYLSPAFDSLCAIARRQPRKARGWGSTPYLGAWGESARNGRPPWVTETAETAAGS